MASDIAGSGVTKTPFQLLQFRVSEAHWRWKVWKQLFLADPAKLAEAKERQRIQNSAAPVFFAMLQDVILQDVVLRLCKLADAEEGGHRQNKRRNFSLSGALIDARDQLSPANSGAAEKAIQSFKAASTALIKWRHWKFAHDDYEVAVGGQALPKLAIADVDAAMKSAVEVMQLLDPNAAHTEFAYDGTIAFGDGDSIMYAL